MKHRRSYLVLAVVLPLLSLTILPAGDPVKSFHIGISDSIIRGQTTPAAAMIQVEPMSHLFSVVGGVKPQFSFETPEALAKNIHDGKVQLGVITGIELGWLGEKAAGLEPLAVAYTSDIKTKALVLMRKDSSSRSLRDYQGKRLAMPRRTQHHAQVFLHDSLSRCGCSPQGYFAATTPPPDTDAAIEAVLDKESDLVIVDGASWDVFQERKPGRARKLVVVAESPNFPNAALIHKPGCIPEDDLKKLRDGLFTAHQQPFCRQILNFWRISQFIPSTPEYDALVKNIVKEFPQPIIPAT
ncbi:MAG TPA: PhnD/SsuA/transferrin family substrate-binding protein, partial [Gemmatales bacterium]|nr:PhnD/SsuA/transferrin family substrate-binding protein [Gemmatales bacterium]